jgi:hypothetical protein
LQVRFVRAGRDAEDADRGPAVDLFQSIQDGAEVAFVIRVAAHVVDPVGHHQVHARFAHPLRRDQFGERLRGMKRIGELVQVSEVVAIGVGGHQPTGQEDQQNQQEGGKSVHGDWNRFGGSAAKKQCPCGRCRNNREIPEPRRWNYLIAP